MLNRNGKAYLYPTMALEPSNQACIMKNLDGSDSYTFSNIQITNIFVRGGSGNTNPTVNDWNLATPVTNLTEIDNTNTQKRSPRSFEDNFIMTVSTTYQNNTGSDVTIKELGLFIHESQADVDHMIARQLVDPVIVRAGRSYAFTMTIG